MAEYTDEDMLDWLGKDARRLEDVRSRLNSEGGSIRRVLTALMASAPLPEGGSGTPTEVVEPYGTHPSWRRVYDLRGGSLILASARFDVELGADGVWRGENEEIIAKAMSYGGQTWPRHLTLRLSQGRFSADTTFLASSQTKKDATRVGAAQQAIQKGVLFPCCRLVIEDAKPGAKLTGLQMFEIC